ncbi:histidine kinase [Salinibacter sp. 10B]|nr:histidine kinase [Salinibacter sp. 10B]
MSPSAKVNQWLPSPVNRLALKIAGAMTLAVTGIAAAVSSWPSWGMIGAGSGFIAYVVAHYTLARRLDQAHRMLHHIRQHAFEDLTAPTNPHSDELRSLIWEIYRTGQTLENEIQELKERESYRREFIGNVSHELKTPIFSVQGFAETLLDGALDDEDVNRTFLEKILHNVSRLENLARDLSAITKIETGEMEMSTGQFAPSAIFEEVRESLEIKAKEKDITLRCEVEANLPSVYGDRDRLRRVLVNLADNAIKYNEAGGTVLLRAVHAAPEAVEISVSDDGIGIPSEHLPRLTERFYRVDKSRSRNQGGTGLGLAIVKHILGAHNRELHLDSTPGEGSTFSFTLPTTPFDSLNPA